jgi:hypothetical protein
MVDKEGPLCSQGSAFGLEFAELLLACLINLLPKSFGTLSVSVWALLQQLDYFPIFKLKELKYKETRLRSQSYTDDETSI